MGNHVAWVLAAMKRRKRGTASVVSVAAIGALALGTLGAGTAAAHGMIGSGDITNQTVQSQDIGPNAVGASEVGPNAVHKWNISHNSVGAWELHPYAQNRILDEGRVQEDHLANGLKKKVNREDRPPQGVWHDGEDGVTDLPAGERVTVGTLGVGPGSHLITAQATVSSSEDNDNMLCYLNGQEQDMSVANARALREAFTLTAIVTNDSDQRMDVTLECQAGAGGNATDVSITGVRVASPPESIN